MKRAGSNWMERQCDVAMHNSPSYIDSDSTPTNAIDVQNNRQPIFFCFFFFWRAILFSSTTCNIYRRIVLRTMLRKLPLKNHVLRITSWALSHLKKRAIFFCVCFWVSRKSCKSRRKFFIVLFVFVGLCSCSVTLLWLYFIIFLRNYCFRAHSHRDTIPNRRIDKLDWIRSLLFLSKFDRWIEVIL